MERNHRLESQTRELEIGEQEHALAKQLELIKDLETDLQAMVVKAPHDGIVYYGTALRGKWITAATLEKKLLPGGRVTSREIIMTIVDPKPLQVRVAVPEDKLKDLEEKQKAKVSLKWNDDVSIDSSLQSISYVPQADNTFDCVFSLNAAKVEQPVYPGMSAQLKMTFYHNEKALVVPKGAVKKSGEKSYVIMKDGKKQWVKTGPSNKEKTVITEGLKAGDEIETGK